jgi:hypothetical protein
MRTHSDLDLQSPHLSARYRASIRICVSCIVRLEICFFRGNTCGRAYEATSAEANPNAPQSMCAALFDRPYEPKLCGDDRITPHDTSSICKQLATCAGSPSLSRLTSFHFIITTSNPCLPSLTWPCGSCCGSRSDCHFGSACGSRSGFSCGFASRCRSS